MAHTILGLIFEFGDVYRWGLSHPHDLIPMAIQYEHLAISCSQGINTYIYSSVASSLVIKMSIMTHNPRQQRLKYQGTLNSPTVILVIGMMACDKTTFIQQAIGHIMEVVPNPHLLVV